MTEFVIVRHGETSYNKDHIVQGWYNIPLNETGHAQAEAAAELLRNETFDEAWYSDLNRTAETAGHILKHHPALPAFPHPPLREWRLGIIQNRPHTEILIMWPEYKKMLGTEEMDLLVPGGERRSEFQKRVNFTFQELALKSPGKKLLIVTHGGVLVRLYRFIGGPVPADNKVPIPANASISRVCYDHKSGKWGILQWSTVAKHSSVPVADAPSL